MRASVPFASVMIHTLPAPVTIDPSLFAIGEGNVAFTAPLFRSTRAIVLSPQFGTHRLPNPVARPEHGPLPIGITAATVLVFGSKRATLSFGRFETHTDSSTAIQSGDPGYGNTASGFSRSIGIFTPGVLTPGFGARAGCRTTHPSSNPIRLRSMSCEIITPHAHAMVMGGGPPAGVEREPFRRAGWRLGRPGGTVAGASRVVRSENPSDPRGELLRLPHRSAHGRPPRGLTRGAAQRRPVGPGDRARRSRQEPADRG